jgi:hypothetical protein
MEALMERLDTQEVGTGRVCGNRAAALPGHSVGVVRTRVSGTLTGVQKGGVPFLLNHRCGKFEICDGYVAGAIRGGD